MKAAILCFSLTGWNTGKILYDGLMEKGIQVTLEGKSRYLPNTIEVSTQEWTKERFEDCQVILFIGACGIAVRSIAPYIQSKKTDPAVLVIDECGNYVISLLSGHLGGANEMACEAAKILNAEPVITTATDLHEHFAVDVFAKKNHCAIKNMKAAKEVSAALLAGKTVGFYSEFPYVGQLPKGLVSCVSEESSGTDYNEKPDIGIAVTIHRNCLPFASTVQIIPPAGVLGMGCKKGKEAAAVMMAADDCIERNDIYEEAFSCIASIDIKKEEAGIHSLSEKWGIPFITYTGEELEKAEGEFTSSAFVKKITGTDNVCERSAVLGSGQGVLIQKKSGNNGVTTAVALKNWRAYFE